MRYDIDAAAATIRDGGLAIYPTETCYGLGCDALNEAAIESVYAAKQRPREKGLTVIVSSREMVEQYCRLSTVERRLCDAFMPGPLTLVANKMETVPDLLNTGFVFRIPGNTVARRLCEAAGGPVVATSANISGRGPHYDVADIENQVVEAADTVLDAGTLDKQEPSTIVEVVDGTVQVHRDGPVAVNEIEAVVHG